MTKHSIGTFKTEVESRQTNVDFFKRQTEPRNPNLPSPSPDVAVFNSPIPTTPTLEKGAEGATSAKYLASEKLKEKRKSVRKPAASVRQSKEKLAKGKKKKTLTARKK